MPVATVSVGQAGRTRPSTTGTPSAASRRAWSTSWPGTSRPVEVTTRHHGWPTWLPRYRPTARWAPGWPASVATSP